MKLLFIILAFSLSLTVTGQQRWELTGKHAENVFYLVDSMTAFVRANTHRYCECPAWQKYLDSLPRIKITRELKSMLQSLGYYYDDEVMPGEIFEVVARPTKEMLIEFPVSPIIDTTLYEPTGTNMPNGVGFTHSLEYAAWMNKKKDTVFIKNVGDYQEGKVNVLVTPSGRKSVVTIVDGQWRNDSELHDWGINSLMTTKFGLVQVSNVYYLHIIFGKPRKDYLVPTSKIQATKFSKEYSLQIGKWEKIPENFTVL